MLRFFSLRGAGVLAGLVAAVLSSTYYVMKLRQECGEVPLFKCAISQTVIVSQPKSNDLDQAAEDARKAAEHYKREREEAERRLRIAEAARRLAEEKGAAEKAQRAAEQAAEDAQRAAEQYKREREEATRLARAAEAKRANEEARRLAEERERAALEARRSTEPRVTLASLAGNWRGAYAGGANARPVEFLMTLQVFGSTCQGRMEEPNTFGHPSAPKLYANVECRLLVGSGPPRLVLRKVYDGTGGQSHAVHYEGDLSWDGRTVNGNWRIGATTGRFSLTKY